MAYADVVREIYIAGAQGQTPLLPTDLNALVALARDKLTPSSCGYILGDAGCGGTGLANRESFERWRLVPRLLRDVSARDLTITLFGQRFPAPLLLAPVAAQTIADPDGELATARAAAELGLPFILSTASSFALEEVAGAAGDTPRWFQLY